VGIDGRIGVRGGRGVREREVLDKPKFTRFAWFRYNRKGGRLERADEKFEVGM